MPFPIETLGCDMHLLLDVIKGIYCIKDCEDNPSIATTDPRDERTIFENKN
jgi:hypothetical protein